MRFETLRGAATAPGVLFVLAILCCGAFGRSTALAIYALSFWHYYLYGLAYVFGSVPLAAFKREAIAMKTVSILVLSSVYLAAPPDVVSLSVVVAGFALNISAAAALGSDRTYYGHEVADLPPIKVTAFPYSIVAHPMLIGNIAAFGGTMINAEFREHWWPLAGAHVALNIGLLFMELGVAPGRGKTRRRLAPPANLPGTITLGSVAGAAAAGLGTFLASRGFASAGLASPDRWSANVGLAAALGASIFAYAFVQYARYTSPAPTPVERGEITLRSVP